MKYIIPWFFVLIFFTSSLYAIDQSKYVIITDAKVDGRDSYIEAVNELTKLRKPVKIINLNNRTLDEVFEELKVISPKYVALVVRPELIEDNFVGKVFEGLTMLDGDPYLDCAFGYITGMTSDDAVKLVLSTARAEASDDYVNKKFVAIAHTFAQNDLYPFALQNAKIYKSYGYETETINPKDDSPEWRRKADREIKKLANASLVFLAGHGMGDRSCNISGDKIGGIELKSAVVVNGTCHSAVTHIRHDSTDYNWTIATTRIQPKKSVCLNFIKAGAIGQFASTASSSWPNVGFTISYFFDKNLSLGEALQMSTNDKIRAAGIKKIDILPFKNGKRSPQALGEDRNPGGIQSLARVVLIGDPAYRPFPNEHPTVVSKDPGSSELKSPTDKRVLELIAKLSDPHEPRFKAMNEIIDIGEDAVPMLIREMRTNDDWQIPKALGAIGHRRAVEPLITKLQREQWSPMREVIAEALQRITKKDFGTDANRWNTWWKSEKIK